MWVRSHTPNKDRHTGIDVVRTAEVPCRRILNGSIRKSDNSVALKRNRKTVLLEERAAKCSAPTPSSATRILF
jgi:hypothetical protein